ncbi:Spx/MgsR family RNA polymerase-binding regulatory protein [Sulfuriroseicoccus oceanibius]|uniref:Spx/MgsR family RNA polymerase-binding regulatory protein n=1 Tax=Sulfuriroseicoccus oceanibius TaxID=2707525 RepID=A0A6B3L881_9BACT|nr:Spx/MgsR family RNA polymerase-binding regulatory protein [Sulfuriroseicoccus oceanibius]QQL44953.1 Spx/MgsR family RNA polymerase-binding regulatory protein [Sulfuriroseicoccus oceanibius]
MIRVYAYKNCDGCRKAVNWLGQRGVEFEQLPVRETPPSVEELEFAATAVDGGLRKLFNTAGKDYREMGMKDKLPQMTEEEAIELLSQHGNLVKRPLLLDRERGIALAGFKEAVWAELF